MIECVVNISEGRNLATVETIGCAAGTCLLDTHTDPDHNRSVLTLAGNDADQVAEAARALAACAVQLLDIRRHEGVHPRIGVVDVVPFVPLGRASMTEAVAHRDAFAAWSADTLGVPCFLYGPGSEGPGGAARDLPSVRHGAFHALLPDTGPAEPHPSAGAMAVGARPTLVAYNVWLDTAGVEIARRIAVSIRSPQVRALGLATGGRTQVSCNLIAPESFGPADVFDAVAEIAGSAGVMVERAELVGLMPEAVLSNVPRSRWSGLDLAEDRTIEARLAAH